MNENYIKTDKTIEELRKMILDGSIKSFINNSGQLFYMPKSKPAVENKKLKMKGEN